MAGTFGDMLDAASLSRAEWLALLLEREFQKLAGGAWIDAHDDLILCGSIRVGIN